MRAIVLFFLISGMLTACGGNDKSASLVQAKANKEHSEVVAKVQLKPNKSGGVSKQKLEIVTSIKPIQAIVLAITGDAINVKQLIPDYASPHDYSFKPSDIRKVNKADVIFRIDEHMETQLNGLLDNIDTDKTLVVSLAEANGLSLLHASGDHADHKESHDHQTEEHQHNDNHENDHDHDHDHQNNEHATKQDSHEHDSHDHKTSEHDSSHNNIDFHIWTSPKNAVLMANKVAKTLGDLDAENKQRYQQNIESFYEKVKAESEKIALKLSPYKDQPYIVFHNSWQYFAAEFGLQKPIVIDLHEGVSSGAKTISDVRERIVNENINCVFYDLGISLARLNTISKKVKTVEIDVLAKNITLDQSTYINWLVQLGNQIETCLSK